MTNRIAVGSSDGEWIDEHFGSCGQFWIYDVTDEGEWNLYEIRKPGGSPSTGSHNEEQLRRRIELVSDCSKVLVSRVGSGVGLSLQSLGIATSTEFISLKHARSKLIFK